MPRGRRKTIYTEPLTSNRVQSSLPVSSPPIPSNEENAFSGLFLFGQIVDRTRRTIKTRDNSSAEIVTYAIQDINGRRYFVDEYAPNEYYEISEYAELPVYVKTFKKHSGDIGYSFCVQQPFGSTRGEHF